MLRFFRPLQAILLALLLTATAQTMAEARSMTVAVSETILCTGTGPLMVPVDAYGNPTGPPHICPEFALALTLQAPVHAAPPLHRVWVQIGPATAITPCAPTPLAHVPLARGPPVVM